MTKPEEIKPKDGEPVNPDADAISKQLKELAQRWEGVVMPSRDYVEEDSNVPSPGFSESEAPTAETLDPKEFVEGFIKRNFSGPAAEVTVPRNIPGSKEKRMEGGWEVSGPDKEKPGNLLVINRALKANKSLKPEVLLALQPFQVGEAVPVLRDNGKRLDAEGWTVEYSVNGSYAVKKNEKGRDIQKLVTKSDLINAKIRELENRRRGITEVDQVVSQDYPILDSIDKDIEYWQGKLKLSDAMSAKIRKGSGASA